MSLSNCRMGMILAKQPNQIINGTFGDGLTNWSSTTHSETQGNQQVQVPDLAVTNGVGLLYAGGTATYTQPTEYEILFDDVDILWCVGVMIVSQVNTTVTVTITLSDALDDGDDKTVVATFNIVGGRQLYSYGSSNWISLTPYVPNLLGYRIKTISFHSAAQLWIDDLQMASFP